MAYFTNITLELLYTAAGNQCSFPGCAVEAVDFELKRAICDRANSKVEKPRSARYDQHQPAKERNEYPNLTLLCPWKYAQ